MSSLDLSARGWDDYAYLDSGEGERLERFGPYVLVRPSPQSLWKKSRPDLWKKAHGVYTRSSSGGGSWRFEPGVSERWSIGIDGLSVILKPTGFGHLGLFPEQAPCWQWLEERARALREPSVLNLFAYTGVSTLFLLRAGARVTHVDASRGVVSWARENLDQSRLEKAPVRWITDEAKKYMKRELKRGVRYDGIVLDPPTFGRGPKGEVFKLEEEILELIDLCTKLLGPEPKFVLFTSHTPGMSPPVLENLFRLPGGRLETGHMLIASETGSPPLPSGVFARWSSG